MRRLILVILAMLVAVVGTGCSRKPILAGTAQVPIHVWVVLGYTNTGGPELIGGSSNRGCRLTQAQMQAIIRDLQDNASVFGLNPQFVWDDLFYTVTDAGLLPFTARTRSLGCV